MTTEGSARVDVALALTAGLMSVGTAAAVGWAAVTAPRPAAPAAAQHQAAPTAAQARVAEQVAELRARLDRLRSELPSLLTATGDLPQLPAGPGPAAVPVRVTAPVPAVPAAPPVAAAPAPAPAPPPPTHTTTGASGAVR